MKLNSSERLIPIVLFANTDWYLYNFRCSLCVALREAGYDVLLVSPPGQYGPKLRDLGFRWHALPMKRRSLNPLREAVVLWQLFSLFKRERPALVHSFTIKSAVYGALAAQLADVQARINAVAGMGYVFSSNETKARLLRPWVKMLLKLAFGGECSRLILQNPDDVALFERDHLADPQCIRLIRGSGVDCEKFTPIGSHQRGHRIRVVLPARLLWDKGVAEYIEAARRLRGEGRAIDFLLAGDPDPGNPAAVPEADLRAWETEGVVQWLGHVDNMAKFFQSVDIVVLPSYREGLPKGLIEAGASGLALVTTDAPGCREVVQDGINGLLVPVKDASALARAIARLHDDPALAVRLGKEARVRALAEFDEHLVIERTMSVYQELLPRGMGDGSNT